MIRRALPSRQEVMSLASQLAGALLGFAVIALVARRLEASELGAWLLYLSVSTFVDMLRSGIYSAALVRELTEAPAEARAGLCAAGLALAAALSLPVALLAALATLLAPEAAPLLACGAALAVAAVPGQHALAVQQAAHRFDRILWLRLIAGGLLLAFLLAGLGGRSASGVAVAHLLAQAGASVIALACGWNGLLPRLGVRHEDLGRLFRFGRYSIGTLAATNLLRSLDSCLIGLFAGPAAVAAYGLPMKLVELLEVPIRGFAATAYPRFAALARRADPSAVGAAAAEWARRVTLLLAPLVAVLAAGAPLALQVIGAGEAGSVAVLRVLCIYGLLLPLDRALGLALDAIGRPEANLRKVSIMALVNAAGDLAALQLGAPLEAIAAVSVAMTVAGIVVGRSLVAHAAREARGSDTDTALLQLTGATDGR